MKDLPNLDLIRSMAVLSVFFSHLLLAFNIQRLGPFPVPWIGIVGVLVFFVHTALVLMWSMERRPHVLDFYIRRIFRIYPLAILAILMAYLFHAPVAGPPTHIFDAFDPNLSQLLANLALMQNINAVPPLEGVMWSLPLEVQMYVLLPVIFFFVRRNFAQWPLMVLFTLAILLTVIPTAGPTLIMAAPYFIAGIIAYVGFGRRAPTLPGWLLPLLLTLAGAVFLLRPGFRIASGFCLVVGAALPSFRQIKSRPLQRASHEVAKYSYGIYLAHPFALVLGIYLMPHAAPALQIAIVVAATAALSIGAYHLLELPMIRLGSQLAGRAERRYEQRDLSHYRAE